MENTVIKVGGMSCQGCVKNITGVLGGMAGVASAEVSLEAGEAKSASIRNWWRARRWSMPSRMPASTLNKAVK
jgi:cation transport ATPase